MNGHPRHPGTEELAEFRAGVTDGVRGDQVAAHLAECPSCVSVSGRLGEVSALLASVPVPAMPTHVEDRITTALAAEAAAPAASPLSSSLPGSRRPASRSRAGRRRSRVSARLGVPLAAAACLVLAFAGYQLSGASGPAAPAVASNGAAHAGRSGPAGRLPPFARPQSRTPSFSPATRPATTASFAVVVASTDFREATLQEQVRQQLGTARGGHARPSASLVGCVMRLTGHARPILVERAAYQSRPAYVIAGADRIWVVARSCTAASPKILASVSLRP